jgi:hypothetical protein
MNKTLFRLGNFNNDSYGITINRFGSFRYSDVSGWGFAAVGVGF